MNHLSACPDDGRLLANEGDQLSEIIVDAKRPANGPRPTIAAAVNVRMAVESRTVRAINVEMRRTCYSIRADVC